jgi:NADPH-dependent ferric siderophore reductase
MADRKTIAIADAGGNSLAPSDSKRAGYQAGLLERAITRLLMRPARVTGVTSLSENFRLIGFQGEALKNCTWSPGDKVQLKLDGGLITRTYTPVEWDWELGRTHFLAYCHGAGPGSEWARQVMVGDQRQFFGPRGSLELVSLASPTVLFGDETSFALAVALERNAEPSVERRFIFEVNDRRESAAVLGALGLEATIVVERRPDDAHLHQVSHAIRGFVQPTSTFVLSGKASSIQHVSRTLKANGIETRRLRAKAYWAPGKVGLD